MEARYNLTGTERKGLVKAIENVIHQTPIYKKAPTFEYAVGDFIIDKNGTVSCDDADALERLVHNLIEDGYRPEEDTTETPAAEPVPEGTPGADPPPAEPNETPLPGEPELSWEDTAQEPTPTAPGTPDPEESRTPTAEAEREATPGTEKPTGTPAPTDSSSSSVCPER